MPKYRLVYAQLITETAIDFIEAENEAAAIEKGEDMLVMDDGLVADLDWKFEDVKDRWLMYAEEVE